MSSSEINVKIPASPFSSDPFTYDYSAHHLCFRSILGTLTTQYKRGEIIGQLAHSWTVNDNFTEWHFLLRKNITFTDGQQITPMML